MKTTLKIIVAAQIFLWISPCFAQQKIRIACIGTSITYGHGLADPAKNSYPAQLQALLGNRYEVGNYGVNGATLLHKADLPYWNTPAYQQALKSRPDIVFIELGTNDSKLRNRGYLNDFVADYKELVHSFTGLASKPRVVLLLSLPAFTTDTSGIWDPVISRKIIPAIQKVAYDLKLELINLHPLLTDQSGHFPDHVHPDATGLSIIAKRLAELISQKQDFNYNIFSKIDSQKRVSSYYGYECADFKFHGRACKIVKPKWSNPNHLWIWRARFWGTEPQTEIALLERGYHLVYCDAAELFGNDGAVNLWNDYYALVHQAGLFPKAVLEGMSRGGVYVYNWAAVNPDKVAFIYADNPVLDLKSWPGGRGKGPGSKNDWETFKRDYGINTEAAIDSFANSPINKAAYIVAGHYPMLHVCGDADETVPMEENTLLFERKIKALGGDITVIHKPNGHHHPHSLPNPTPIVDLVLKAQKQQL